MAKIKAKGVVLCTIITLIVFISPQVLFAGGLKAKIQKRLSGQQSIQFNAPVDGYDGVRRQSRSAPQREGEAQGAGGQILDQIQLNEGMSVGDSRRGVSLRVASPAKPAGTPASSPILSAYVIYQTNYDAELDESVATVSGKVIFEVFKRGWIKIPLVRSSVGLIDVSVNRGTAFVVMEGNKYYLMIDRPGRYTLHIEFLIKATREREGGPGNFSFEVMPAPISQYEFQMPETGVEIFVEPAIKVEVTKDPKRTTAWAVMPNTNSITTRWTKALPKEEITKVKLEPKVHVNTASYASVGEGVVRCYARLNYSILQSEVSVLRVALPEDVSLLDVAGRDLRDWKVATEDSLQYLDVYLNFGIKGNYVLNLIYERGIGDGSVVAELPWAKAVGAERETGYFGVAASTNVELAVSDIEGVSEIDVKELPSSIWGSSANPILLAFKYLKHPFNISIDVKRHEELPVLIAAIDTADYMTLYTEEGKNLTKATYQVRNNVKQFIRLVLPKGAELWSAFVTGKPVKPAKDKNGSILIPLEKSQLQGESLTRFPVEIVYLDKLSKMKSIGGIKINLPQTDIPISEFRWSMYLPSDYKYFNFGGDVKQVTGAFAPLKDVSGVASYRGRRYSKEEKYARSQFDRDIGQFDDKQGMILHKKGALPIKVTIPQRGSLVRFSKLIVTEKESPWMSASYITVMKRAHGLIWFLVVVLVVGFIVKLIKKSAKARA